jgi:hypothetical protein
VTLEVLPKSGSGFEARSLSFKREINGDVFYDDFFEERCKAFDLRGYE